MMRLAEECGLAVVETAALREDKRQSDAFEECLRAVWEQTQREEARQRAQMRREARAARRKLRFWRLAAVLAMMVLTAVLLTTFVRAGAGRGAAHGWTWIGGEANGIE